MTTFAAIRLVHWAPNTPKITFTAGDRPPRHFAVFRSRWTYLVAANVDLLRWGS